MMNMDVVGAKVEMRREDDVRKDPKMYVARNPYLLPLNVQTELEDNSLFEL